ncbi:hypothetical protein C8N30_0623 [Sulfitobacter guttiformis]|uniref:Uncharacterized protein n=1 Tax=Sulfitobacter guttiformis TaxID=74349 RepID=A0A420DPB4_9RHOB|nr:hypothetical protein C8N30_0623 [Sulfitobacter guttiformis]
MVMLKGCSNRFFTEAEDGTRGNLVSRFDFGVMG